MKTLYLIRHAKSSWEFDVSDENRPLNERGFKDANLIGEKLKDIVNTVDRAISSPAKRAHTTAEIILKHLGLPDEVFDLEPDLYDFEGYGVMEAVKKCDDAIQTLMIFGHNHAFTSIANFYGDQRIDNLPTAGVVKIQFDIEKWKDIGVGKTLLIVSPKMLK